VPELIRALKDLGAPEIILTRGGVPTRRRLNRSAPAARMGR